MRLREQLIVVALTLPLMCTASADLLGRFPATPGGTDYQAYYDDQLNITWAADANRVEAAAWNDQMQWAFSLVIGAVSNWRLPEMDVNGDGTVVDCAVVGAPACLDNEYGYMYYQNSIIPGSTGPFASIAADKYWSGTADEVNPATAAWAFNFGSGGQNVESQIDPELAWAVRDGDIAAFDLDGDGTGDSYDNCYEVANPDQRDVDSDGHGSLCDADFDNSCLINFIDLNLMKSGFFGNDPELDLDGSGLVNFVDLNLMKGLFFGPPGPSAAGICSITAAGTWNDFVWNGAKWQ